MCVGGIDTRESAPIGMVNDMASTLMASKEEVFPYQSVKQKIYLFNSSILLASTVFSAVFYFFL